MGGITSYTYDGKGNMLSVTDAIGITKQFTWNEKNKQNTLTNGEGETTSYDYDAKGNLTTIFQPNGNTINYFYDQLDRVVQISDNMGVIAKYTYDNNGNLLTISDGLDHIITYTYDALNRKTSETLPSGATTHYEYDNNSNLVNIKDAKGNSTAYTYDALNHPLTRTDALNAKTIFEYDANSNLSKITDAKGNTTTCAYDASNRATSITFANGLSLQYTYDELGNIIGSKDRAGNEFKYTYNPLGNLLTKVYPDGSSDTYTYDQISRMLSAINKDATVTFSYDKANRLVSESLNDKVTGYKYDVAGGKRTLTYPSGMKVEEHLNARDLITSIFKNGEEVVTMAYNVAGQKTKQSYANGISTEFSYNENGWLSSIVDDHDILNYKMTYDAVGNITLREDLLDAGQTETYGYDVISQLTSFRRGTSVDKSYEFDLLGNRTRTTENGEVTNYTTNNVNAYTNITGGINFVPTYDDNGNILNDARNHFVYDFNNRIYSANDEICTYDALGRRISKNGLTYYYKGDQLIEQYSADGDLLSFITGNKLDETLLLQHNENSFYYHLDELSSTKALSTSDGDLVEKIIYDPYGLPIFISPDRKEYAVSSVKNNILFNGREYDFIVQDYYYRNRHLNSPIGRFMQHDPLLYIDGMNDYSYVLNNPITRSDPYGLRCWQEGSCWYNQRTVCEPDHPILGGLTGGALLGGLLGGIIGAGAAGPGGAVAGFAAGAKIGAGIGAAGGLGWGIHYAVTH